MRRGRWFTRQALFPTLRKELVERASRRRTHVIRTVYGLFFFGGFLWAYVRLQERQPGLAGLKVIPGLSVIGQGDDLFRDALNIQWLGLI